MSQREGINLVELKYAYMMKSTVPDKYRLIESFLPIIDEEKQKMIDDITDVYMKYQEEIRNEFLSLKDGSRPLYAESDTGYSTSVEKYFRGEISTYSKEILTDFRNYILGGNPLFKEFRVMAI